jgi:hypothetical protein
MKTRLLMLGALVSISSAAWAHSLTITASASCSNNAAVISYTVTSWDLSTVAGSNSEIDVLFNGLQVDAQPFVLPGNQFSGQKPGPSGATSVTVETIAANNWGDGAVGGQTDSTTVTIPSNCSGGTYYVDYYANNVGPIGGSADQIIRIIITSGTPLTSPVGDICANIYIFDADQELIACCSERLTPNELDSMYVGRQLTANTVTSVVPSSGVIKIVLAPLPFGGCNPAVSTTIANASLGQVFGTHLNRQVPESATATFVRRPRNFQHC